MRIFSNASLAEIAKNTSRRTLILLFITLPVLLLPSIPSLCSSNSSLKFYIINNPYCKSCAQEIQPLLDLYEEQITGYNIWEPNNTLLYNAVINFTGFGIKELPLVIVFKSNRLFAIVFGHHGQTDWEAILTTEYESVPIYYSQYFFPTGISIPSGYITEQEKIDEITDLFIQDGPNFNEVPDIFTLLPLIALAAVADAVNPCEFYVLTAFLSLTLYHVGRKAVLKSGIAYSVADFYRLFPVGNGYTKIC